MTRMLALAVVIALGAGGQAQAAYCKDPTTHKRISCNSAALTDTSGKALSDEKGASPTGTPAKKPSMFSGMMKPKAATTPMQSPMPATGTAPSTASKASGGRKAPNCVKGKLCGMSCIKAADVCHKPK